MWARVLRRYYCSRWNDLKTSYIYLLALGVLLLRYNCRCIIAVRCDDVSPSFYRSDVIPTLNLSLRSAYRNSQVWAFSMIPRTSDGIHIRGET